jgi:predicted metal-dependent hydrolase
MRLRVDSRTGEVTLTYPKRVSQRRALDWAAGQRAWVETALAQIPREMPIAPGAMLPLEGVPHLIEWDEGRSRVVTVEEGRILVGGPLDTVESRLIAG